MGDIISFVALISATLVFSHSYTGVELLKHCGYILIGGLFYLFVSLLFYFLRPHRYIDLQLADCLRLTSKYLKLRGDLWNVDANRAKITEKQLELQVEINAIHENIREYLIRNAINSNNSNQNRRKLIVFTNLVEILEIALSFAFNHNHLHQKFESHPEVLKTYQNLAYTIASTLKKMSQSLEADTEYVADKKPFTALEHLENVIQSYQEELGNPAAAEGVLMLKNMQHYAQKQIEKVKVIEQALTGLSLRNR